MRKPFYKKSHGCWYVKDPRTQRAIRLDPDERKAYDMWRRLLDASAPLTTSVPLRRLAEHFLNETCEANRGFEERARHIAAFVEHVGSKQASDVSPRDVLSWLTAEKPGQRRKGKDGQWVEGVSRIWGDRTKQVALAAIKRMFKWSVDEGVLTRNPIRNLKVDSPRPRQSIISQDEHRRLMEVAHPAFRLVLIAATCGARPQQIREVCAKDVLPDFSAWVVQGHKTRRSTNKPIVVYLHPCLSTLTRILVYAHPTGPLFRNSQGRAWTKDTIVRQMARLREKLQLPDDACLYSYRHTFATNALMANVPIQSVSALLGHTDTRMVSNVYGHLDQHRHHLAEVARLANNQRVSQP
jgi:integrase